MTDLEPRAGFDLRVDPDTCMLRGRGRWVRREPDVRTLEAMRPVLRRSGVEGPDVLYWMYRGAGPARPQQPARRLGLRFDLTVLRPGIVGDEYVKTFGHRHPSAPDGLPYPELYQVLHGRAWFLLQGEDEVRIGEGGPGECLLIPPGFGHVTVNVGTTPLVLANWIDGNFQSDYGPYLERAGAAYYVVRADGQPEPRANPHYPDPPPQRRVPPTAPRALGLARAGQPIFEVVCTDPARFRFLTRPSERPDLWRDG